MHVFEDLTYIGSDFNDKASSLVILEGNWMFFIDSNLHNGLKGNVNTADYPPDAALSVGPGIYNSITAILGPSASGSISSLRPVNTPAGKIELPS
jgi:hypothetical protein